MKERIYLVFLLVLLFCSNSSAQIKIDDGPIIELSPEVSTYSLRGVKWKKTNLCYYIYNSSNHLTLQERVSAIQNAFQIWQSQCALTFTQVYTASQADIVVKWATRDHGDNSPFDGQGNVLAHGFFPPPAGGFYSGHLHFDDDENWSVNGTGIDLETVAIHELGHVLGLDHSTCPDAIMYPYYIGVHRGLSMDDITAIKTLYSDIKVTGPVVICNTEEYSVENVPDYTVIHWSTTNTNLQLVTGQGSETAEFLKLGNGECGIVAQIQMESSIISDTLMVWAGVPSSPQILYWPSKLNPNSIYSVSATQSCEQEVNQYQWTLQGGTIIGSSTGSSVMFRTGGTGTDVQLSVRAKNVCGWGSVSSKAGRVKDGNSVVTGTGDGRTINITMQDPGRYEIQLWNKTHLLRKEITEFQHYTLNINALPSDIYFVKVLKDGEVVQQSKFLK